MARISLWLLLLLGFSPAALANTPREVSRPQHRVVAGETLLGIARANGVTVSELQSANGLKGSLIRPGQRLLLPTAKTLKAIERSHKTTTASVRHSKPTEIVAPAVQYLSLDDLPAAGGDLASVARMFLATRYRFGAEGLEATDCSGFTRQVFHLLGFELPRTAREQYRSGAVVPPGEWQRGDLLFFRTYARYPSHVAIYLGDGKMIHASRSQRKVVISEADRPYFRKRLLGVRRIACFDPVAPDNEQLGVTAAAASDGLLEADLVPDPAVDPQRTTPSSALILAPDPADGAPAAVSFSALSASGL